MSVMELSHRSPEFAKMADKAKDDLREFLEIPQNYKIFFFQGGASLQYAAIIKNMLIPGRGANYLNTGLWSNQCLTEAKKMSDVPPTEMASGAKSKFTHIAKPKDWNINKDGSYVHYCQNETVHGFQFQDEADACFPFELFGNMPVVCDMSSDIGSRRVDWTKFCMVYAGAQKNLGAAGVTVVIVREDLIGKQHKDTPFLLDWQLFDKSPNGFFNTPATYPVYVTGLNIAHMIKNGGLSHYCLLAEQRS
jgi:phosphoserine aminotransferase